MQHFRWHVSARAAPHRLLKHLEQPGPLPFVEAWWWRRRPVRRASARRAKSRRLPSRATASRRRVCSSAESVFGGSGTRMNMAPCSLACGGHQGEWWRLWNRIRSFRRGRGAGRFRFRFLVIYRRELETESQGATWARRGAQGRRSPSPSANFRRCRNTRPLGPVGAEIPLVCGPPVQKWEGFGPSRCVYAACFEPLERGMPHGASAAIRRKSARC